VNKKSQSNISMVRARQDIQAVLDVFFHHLFGESTVLIDLEAATKLKEAHELIESLVSIIPESQRGSLFVRNGKGRPAMRHAGHLNTAGEMGKVKARFRVVEKPVHYGPSPRNTLSENGTVATSYRLAQELGEVSNHAVAERLNIKPIAATKALRVLHARGLLDRFPNPNRTKGSPVFIYRPAGAPSASTTEAVTA